MSSGIRIINFYIKIILSKLTSSHVKYSSRKSRDPYKTRVKYHLPKRSIDALRGAFYHGDTGTHVS